MATREEVLKQLEDADKTGKLSPQGKVKLHRLRELTVPAAPDFAREVLAPPKAPKLSALDLLADKAGIDRAKLSKSVDFAARVGLGTAGEIGGAALGAVGGTSLAGPAGTIPGAFAGRTVGGALGAGAAQSLLNMAQQQQQPVLPEMGRQAAISAGLGAAGAGIAKGTKMLAPAVIEAVRKVPRETTEILIKAIEKGKKLPGFKQAQEILEKTAKSTIDKFMDLRATVGEQIRLSRWFISKKKVDIDLEGVRQNLLGAVDTPGLTRNDKAFIFEAVGKIPRGNIDPKRLQDVEAELMDLVRTTKKLPTNKSQGIVGQASEDVFEEVNKLGGPKFSQLRRQYRELIKIGEQILPASKKAADFADVAKVSKGIVANARGEGATSAEAMAIRQLDFAIRRLEGLEKSSKFIPKGREAVAAGEFARVLPTEVSPLGQVGLIGGAMAQPAAASMAMLGLSPALQKAVMTGAIRLSPEQASRMGGASLTALQQAFTQAPRLEE